jgi:hypothetical protein
MGKILSGIVSVVLALGWLAYALVCESKGGDVWLLAKIPALWFYGVEIPRIFVLVFAVAWIGGGITLLADAVGNASSVRTYTRKLRAGKTADQILTEDVEQISWPNEITKLVTRHIARGDPYAASVKAVMRHHYCPANVLQNQQKSL